MSKRIKRLRTEETETSKNIKCRFETIARPTFYTTSDTSIVQFEYAINDNNDNIQYIIDDINTNGKVIYHINLKAILEIGEGFIIGSEEIIIENIYTHIESETPTDQTYENSLRRNNDSMGINGNYTLTNTQSRSPLDINNIELFDNLYTNNYQYFYISNNARKFMIRKTKKNSVIGLNRRIYQFKHRNDDESEAEEAEGDEGDEGVEGVEGGGKRKNMYKVYIQDKNKNKYYIKYNNKKCFLTYENTSKKGNNYYINIDNKFLLMYI